MNPMNDEERQALEDAPSEESEAEAAEASDEAPEEEPEEPDAPDPVEELEVERERYLRLYAEFDNYRKRTQREQREAYNNGVAYCVEQLLPVIDNFERAADAPCADEQYHSGMVMISGQLTKFLEALGVTEVPALGEVFDPKVHNAIKQESPTEDYPENTVCAVFQKGYKLQDRLLRPAMVAVAG